MALGLLSSGLSLLGGILGRRSADRARRRQEYLNSPSGIRAESEAAGFNPLVFAGQAGSFGAGNMITGGQIMAQALTDAASVIPRQQELAIANAQLELERDRLTQQVRQATLQPNVPGIYGAQNENTSFTGDSNGGNDDPTRNDSFNNRPLTVGGYEIDQDPNYSDVEQIETRYGELLSLPYGIAVAGADGLRAASQAEIRSQGPTRTITERESDQLFNQWFGDPLRDPMNRAMQVYSPYQYTRRQSMIENPLRRFQ